MEAIDNSGNAFTAALLRLEKLAAENKAKREVLWNSLTPEQQAKELAAIATETKNFKEVRIALSDALKAPAQIKLWSRIRPNNFCGPLSEWLKTFRNELDDVIICHLLKTGNTQKLCIVTSPDIRALLLPELSEKEEETPNVLSNVGDYKNIPVFVDPYFPTDRLAVITGVVNVPGAVHVDTLSEVRVLGLGLPF